MDEKVIEKSENVVTKTTKAKTPRTKAKTRTVDSLSLSDRVSIDNLCGWTIGFVSEENGKSIQIDPNIKDYKRLTLAEIIHKLKSEMLHFVESMDLALTLLLKSMIHS